MPCKCNDCKRHPPTWLGMARFEPETSEPRIYRIIRFHQSGRPRTIRSNVTLSEAQAHCRDPKTHGIRAGRRWFDGYDYMRGCAPKGAE